MNDIAQAFGMIAVYSILWAAVFLGTFIAERFFRRTEDGFLGLIIALFAATVSVLYLIFHNLPLVTA